TRKMKDSGVEWIGEIPEDWEVVRLKNISKIITGNTPSMSNEEYYSNSKGIPWIKPDNLLEFKGVSATKLRLTDSGKTLGRLVPKNTMLICAIGNIGKFGYTNTRSAFNQQINAILFNSKVISKYGLYYLSVQKEQQKYYGNGNVVQILNTSNQGIIYFTLPDINEQKSIANFLDNKTLEIDNIISKTKEVIKEYKKYKQSLITETVTKGLDKDLEMKDSGIEWIGEIPEHWSFTKLKYLVNCNEQTLSSNTSDDYKFRYIDIGSVDFHKGITGYENMKYKDSPSRARRIVRKGDLIVSTVRTYLRSIATIEDDEDVIVSTGFAVLTPRNVKKKYLEYMTKTEYFISEVIKNSVGVSYPAINSKELLEINISFPPLKEQKQIASYLHKKTREIDNIIRTKEKLITEMEAYKKSLIYETVTGKREVE
ncbi:MAG: restriction endonuclease subunit S, partial [Senegalia sp. (in: firmicutes)]|uniref:restriction endonuclease subunit S n=1 Tax=Senegalia sp. (in: firmicutes) TaxID=1924098 RepID=UPI003F9ADD00